jgi:hypothetical protein
MYGNKRIVIQKDNQIVLAGGHSWITVGKLTGEFNELIAVVFKNKWIRSDGTEMIKAENKKELKELVNKKYNWIKEVA